MQHNKYDELLSQRNNVAYYTDYMNKAQLVWGNGPHIRHMAHVGSLENRHYWCAGKERHCQEFVAFWFPQFHLKEKWGLFLFLFAFHLNVISELAESTTAPDTSPLPPPLATWNTNFLSFWCLCLSGEHIKNWRKRYFILLEDGAFFGFRAKPDHGLADPLNNFTVKGT